MKKLAEKLEHGVSTHSRPKAAGRDKTYSVR